MKAVLVCLFFFFFAQIRNIRRKKTTKIQPQLKRLLKCELKCLQCLSILAINWIIKGRILWQFRYCCSAAISMWLKYSMLGFVLSRSNYQTNSSHFPIFCNEWYKSMIRMWEMKFTHASPLYCSCSRNSLPKCCFILNVMDARIYGYNFVYFSFFCVCVCFVRFWHCHRFVVSDYSCDFYIYWFGCLLLDDNFAQRNSLLESEPAKSNRFWSIYVQ